jgi:hypothetical protein
LEVYEGETTASSDKHKSSPNQRPKGHIYQFIDWKGVGNLPTGNLKVSITLKDLTANKLIELQGVIELVGAIGTMLIDKLEGYSDVYVNVSKHAPRAKVRKHSNGSSVKYCLEDA